MKIIVKRPEDAVGAVTEVDNTLKALQEVVGGHIEAVTLATDLVIICNEEGRLMGLPHNCEVCGWEFVGTIAAVGVNGEEFTDVPLYLHEWVLKWLK